MAIGQENTLLQEPVAINGFINLWLHTLDGYRKQRVCCFKVLFSTPMKRLKCKGSCRSHCAMVSGQGRVGLTAR